MVKPKAFKPDQGWAWVVLGSSFLCITILDGIIYSVGIMFSEFKEHFQTNDALTSWVVTSTGAMYQIISPIAGMMINRFGCRVTTVVGSLISCAGFVVAAYAPNIFVLLIGYGIIAGFGFGMAYLCSYVVVGYYFDKRMALATGIVTSGSGVGMFIFGPLVQVAIQYYTWHGVMLVFAGLALQLCVFGSIFIPVPKQDIEEKTNICDCSLLSDITYIILCLSSFLIALGYFTPFTLIVEVAKERQVTKFEASFLISIIGISNCIARLVAGLVVNMKLITPIPLYIGACIIGGAATIACTHLQSFISLAAYATVFGCYIACFVTLTPIILVQLFGSKKLPNSLGFINLIRGAGALVGPPLAGWLVDMHYDYSLTFYFTGGIIICGGLVCLPLKCLNRSNNSSIDAETNETHESQSTVAVLSWNPSSTVMSPKESNIMKELPVENLHL